MQKLSKRGLAVQNAAILLYLVWLLLPAVQTTGRAATGAFSVALFGAGVLMDWEYFKKNWLDLCARALCAAAMPVVLRVFLERGGSNFAGFYVQNAMFWFPLVFAAHARRRGDERLWRFVKWVLLGAVCVTVCTTIGWLVQGMLRGGKVYAYSRSLGYGGDVNPAYLKELMLRNIGGYDFVYAMVLALPLVCIGIAHHRGWARIGFCALLCAQTVMIVLSQYTYAMLYAAAILAVEIIALLIRRISRGRVGMGWSLVLGAVPLLLVLLFIRPLAGLAAYVCAGMGLNNFAQSFEHLYAAFSGGAAISPDSRLSYYLAAAGGFAQSPFTGSLFSSAKQLSYHSEALDVLSGMGLLGAAVFAGMVWVMGRGLLRGVRKNPYFAQLCAAGAVLLATSALGTVFYSRDIMAVFAMGLLLAQEKARG